MRAAEIYDLFYNRVFLDPLVHGVYPPELCAARAASGDLGLHAEELAIIRDNTVDELGINLYYPHRVKAPSRAWHPQTPFHPAYYYEPFELPGRRMNNSRGWEIYPQIILIWRCGLKRTTAISRGSWRKAGWGWKTKGSSAMRRRHR
jgi:beta-glucosidase